MFEWNEAKREANLAKHKVDFSHIDAFDWDGALTRLDTRSKYGEKRYVSIGLIGERLYVAVWTLRGERTRLISLRKANSREVKFYGKT